MMKTIVIYIDIKNSRTHFRVRDKISLSSHMSQKFV